MQFRQMARRIPPALRADTNSYNSSQAIPRGFAQAMRTNQARKTGPALLDRPATALAGPRVEEIRRAPSEPLRTRREYPGAGGYGEGFDPEDTAVQRNRGRGRRVRRGLIPKTQNGRIAAGLGALAVLGVLGAAAYTVSHFLHHDARFRIVSSSEIELQGNTHLTQSQLLSVFGEDVDGNLFRVPLEERREQLEQMPWVEHATVMRLLPARLRVDVVERTPIAFVRQGSSIGMADRDGVLLDIPPDAPGNPQYSFPVVTGLKAEDTPETREQRMHLYSAFLRDLDSGGKKVSAELSEVDLSDPEDLKALLPSGGGSETLVHFGTGNFLRRYGRFQEHIGEWRSQYPRLSSVDMRYERQVVLQMPPKDSTVAAGKADADTGPVGTVKAAGTKLSTDATRKHGDTRASTGVKPAATTAAVVLPAKPGSAPVTPVPSAIPSHAIAGTAAAHPAHLTEAHAVSPTGSKAAAKQADMAKRVEKIKEWMLRRDRERAQAAH